jgi:hypothetical protein
MSNIFAMKQGDKPPREQSRRVRVIREGWLSGLPNSHAVKIGEELTIPSPDAVGLYHRGLIEYAP